MTIRKVDDAHKAKKKADEEVRRTPYDDTTIALTACGEPPLGGAS